MQPLRNDCFYPSCRIYVKRVAGRQSHGASRTIELPIGDIQFDWAAETAINNYQVDAAKVKVVLRQRMSKVFAI